MKIDNINIFYDGDKISDTMPVELTNYLLKNRLTTLNGNSIQFVGLIELKSVYFVMPKRFPFNDSPEHLALVLKTLNVFNGKVINSELPNCVIGKKTIGKKINLAYYILKDWLSHGVLKDFIRENKKNGNGKINWKRTMDRQLPIDSNGSPIYLDLETSKDQNYINSRIVQIQKKIVVDCDKKYHWILSGKFIAKELHNLQASKENDLRIDILLLRKYANNVYCERTISLLRAMIDYLTLSGASEASSGAAFGTQTFHVLWEDICKQVLGGDDRLKALFPQPRYKYNPGIERQLPKSFIGQIPDILIMKNQNLYVVDAKYYDIMKSSPPGWKDLVKQFFYGWSSTLNNELELKNILLFPGDNYSNVGHVYLEQDSNSLLEFGVVECIEVPILEFMQAYIKRNSADCLNNMIFMSTSSLRDV